MVKPILNVNLRLFYLVRCWKERYLAAPANLRNILHAPHGYAQAHLNGGFFQAASHKFREFALDFGLVWLHNFLGDGSLSFFQLVRRNFILSDICKQCLFYFYETYYALSVCEIAFGTSANNFLKYLLKQTILMLFHQKSGHGFVNAV